MKLQALVETPKPYHKFGSALLKEVDPIGSATKGVDLRPLACWNCGFESCREHRCISVL